MSECLKFKKSNCKNCYKCIRNCPVKSIRFSENQANIIHEECILCGRCVICCPQNAKEIRNDIPAAKALISTGAPVYASIAPSFVANYDNVTILSLKKALHKLGFEDAEETAIGATIVKKQYDEILDHSDSDVIISSCCHSVNLLIQKYYPEALKYLAPVISPMQAHCRNIKEKHPGAKTIFIGPCIAKKAEAETYPGTVDCVLTFEELSAWMKEEKIEFEYIEDKCNEGKARLFPVAGGILRTMEKRNTEYTYLVIDGIENCKRALEDIIDGKISKCFIEMSACHGSCINGPAIDKAHRAPVRDYAAVDRYAKEKDFIVNGYADNELKKEFTSCAKSKVIINEREIEAVLRKMGKVKREDELNCGCCGYNTCRDKAEAVIMGKANLGMCLPYLIGKAESFSDNIITNTPNATIVVNENYEVQQINAAACRLMNLRNGDDIIGDQVVRVLDPLPFMEVFRNCKNIYNKRIFLAEYQKYVEQTVIYDKEYHIIICIMRDVTDEVHQNDEKERISRNTIEITDKVIEKQMKAVHEIASLLGETTAETKIALTKLKESLGNE